MQMKGTNTKLVISGPPSSRCNGLEVKTINPPVHHAPTVLFENYADLQAAGQGDYRGVSFGTDGVPVQRSFEKAMTVLENGLKQLVPGRKHADA